MRLLLVLAVLLTGMAKNSYSQIDPRWKDLMSIVNKELVILNKSRPTPKMEYRKLELYTEKLKLVQEYNNYNFLEYVKTNKPRRSKASFFKETQRQYEITKSYGISLIKKNPRHPYRHNILVVLGFNSRDYSKDNLTKTFLTTVVKELAKVDSPLRFQSESALAEIFFNDKKFVEAKAFYQRISRNKNNPWLSKNIFNLAWCHFQLKNFDQAVALMKYAHKLTKYPKYVKIDGQINDHLGAFFVVAGRPLEAMNFYVDEVSDPAPYLFRLAEKASEKGYARETEVILRSIQNIITKKQQYQYQEKAIHAYLDFYRQYSRFADHSKMSNNAVNYYLQADKSKSKQLKQDLRKEAITKMSSAAGFLQVKLVKDMLENKSIYNKQEMKFIQNYFNGLIKINPELKSEYLYFKGESYYSVRNYKSAAVVYQRSISHAIKTKKHEEARKPLNSLLAVTAQNALPAEVNKKYLKFAYWHHVNLWPKDPKSRQIYPKLFAIYNESNEDESAAGVLINYNKMYPEDLKIQQELMTRVLDIYIERKDTKKLTYWVTRFKKGFLYFDQRTIAKAEEALGNLLFLDFQKTAKEGNHLAAAKGFESIYASEFFSKKIKSQAAFLASMAFLEAGNTDKSFEWLLLADRNLDNKVRASQRKERVSIAERTYQLQDFTTAYKLSKSMLHNFCSMRDQIQKRFYEIAVMTSLVEGNVKDAEEVVQSYSKCLNNSESKEIAKIQIFQFYEKEGAIKKLTRFYQSHPGKELGQRLSNVLQKWYWQSDKNTQQEILSELGYLNIPESQKWLKEIQLYKDAIATKDRLEKYVIWNQPKFDGEAFNKSLEGYLLEYQNYKTAYHGLTESSQLDLTVAATKLFSDLYTKLGIKIQNLNPQGLDPKTLSEVKTAMQGLSAQFITAGETYETQLSKSLRENEALSWVSRSISSVNDIENPLSSASGFTMDMEGN